MNRSETLKEFGTALAAAQAAIKTASKDKANPFFKSKYADLASVWEACRGPLSANGLSVVQVPELHEGGVTLLTIILHSSGEFISAPLTAPLKETTPQAIGSLITYLRRYSLSAMVGIAPDEDDDAEGAMGRGKKNGDGAHQLSADDVARIQSQTCTELKAALAGAKDKAALEIVAADVSKARKEKRVTDDQADKVLGPAYKARLKELTPPQVQQ